jgi:hypothetical protein
VITASDGWGQGVVIEYAPDIEPFADDTLPKEPQTPEQCPV